MADTNGPLPAISAPSPARWSFGLYAVLAGLAAIVFALWLTMREFDEAADVGAVLGVVISPIAAMVAAYFGVQAGSAGKAASDESARQANQFAVRLAESSPQEDVAAALDRLTRRLDDQN
jgi:hypothetical protein